MMEVEIQEGWEEYSSFPVKSFNVPAMDYVLHAYISHYVLDM